MKSILNRRYRKDWIALAFVVTVRLMLGAYWIVRYGENWVEDDTSRMTSSILGVLQGGGLIPASGRLYPNGFLYTVYVTFIALINNVHVIELQKWLFLPMAVILTLLIFILYRRLLSNTTLAAVATVLITLQGDFLYSTTRGTTEKVIYALVAISLLVLAISLNRFHSIRERVAIAIVYYLLIFALSTANVFFASSFTVMLFLVPIIWLTLTYWKVLLPSRTKWLIYISLISFIFIYLVVFVIYPPAHTVVFEAHNSVVRLRSFLFSFEETPAIYRFAINSWIFPQAWKVLHAYDGFLILTAAFGWLVFVRRLIRDRGSRRSFDEGLFLLLGLFPAFAIQNAISLVSDVTGSQSDINNLQVRLIPLTAFAAAPLSAYALLMCFKRLKTKLIIFRMALATAILIISFFVGVSLVKSTLEPLLSNIGLFFTSPEKSSVGWLNSHMPLLSFNSGRGTPGVWAGADFRLGRLWLNDYWGAERQLVPVISDEDEPYSYMLYSPEIRLYSSRLKRLMPDYRSAQKVYDNGDVQIYLKRP